MMSKIANHRLRLELSHRYRLLMNRHQYYLLLLKVSGRRVMELGGFANATEAEQWRQRLQSELQGA